MMIFSIGETTSYMCASARVNLPDSCPLKNEKKTQTRKDTREEKTQEEQPKGNHKQANTRYKPMTT